VDIRQIREDYPDRGIELDAASELPATDESDPIRYRRQADGCIEIEMGRSDAIHVCREQARAFLAELAEFVDACEATPTS
jgi:hypothetical protein